MNSMISSFLLSCVIIAALVMNAAGDMYDVCTYNPITVRIEGYNVFINDKPFLAKGIGYVPTPIGKDITTDDPFGDYYVDKFEGMWSRDLPLMKEMGANLIRVWTWHFKKSHKKFLNALTSDKNHTLYLLVPFRFTPSIYEDLSDPITQKQIIIDFDNFLKRYANHPSVFGFLIGNELDLVYPSQLNWLFAIINSLVELAKYRGVTQPITAPLSARNFIDILKEYYGGSEMQMWSLQPYDPDSLRGVLDDYQRITAYKPKPLLLTEFGASSKIQAWDYGGVYNETYQADRLALLWDILSNQYTKAGDSVVLGGCVMEWVDEWWKANIPDVANKYCPNYDSNKQRDCGVALSNKTFLHESWLGMFAQKHKSQPSLIGPPKFCITPRESYYRMKSIWTGIPYNYVNSSTHEYCASLTHQDPIIYVVVPLVLLTVVYLIVWLMSRGRTLLTRGKKPRKQRISMAVGMSVPRHPTMETARHVIDMIVEASFIMYTSSQGPGRIRDFLGSWKGSVALPDVNQLNQLLAAFNSQQQQQNRNNNNNNYNSGGGGSSNTQKLVRISSDNLAEPNTYFLNEANIPSTFRTAQMRIVHLIWDKMMASKLAVSKAAAENENFDDEVHLEVRTDDDTDDVDTRNRNGGEGLLSDREMALIIQNIRLVYYRYMEGYLLWKDSKKSQFIPGRDNKGRNLHWTDMLTDIVLWNIVSQCAGTINHAPEKVCEVFDHTLRFLAAKPGTSPYDSPWKRSMSFQARGAHVSSTPVTAKEVEDAVQSSMNSNVNAEKMIWVRFPVGREDYDEVGDSATPAPPPPPPSPTIITTYHLFSGGQQASYVFEAPLAYQLSPDQKFCFVSRKSLAMAVMYTGEGLLVQSLMQIFRQYYDDVSTHEVNYDDVNDDANSMSALYGPKNTRVLSKSESTDIVREKGWTPLCDEFLGERILYNKEKNYYYENGGKNKPLVTPVAFGQRGGLFSIIVNYGWLMRLNLWLIILVWFFLQEERDSSCVNTVLPYLAIGDSVLMTCVYVLEYPMTKRVTLHMLAMLTYSFVSLGALIYEQTRGDNKWSMHFHTGDDVSLDVTLAGLYLFVTGVLVMLDEIYTSVHAAPFSIAGRQRKGRLERQVWAGFWIGILATVIAGVLVWVLLNTKVIGTDDVRNVLNYQFDLLEAIFGVSVSTFVLVVAGLAFLSGIALGVGMGKLRILRKKLGLMERVRQGENVTEAVKYVLLTTSFWVFSFAIYWIVLYHILVPSIVGVTIGSCNCNPVVSHFTIDVLSEHSCSAPDKTTCILGVILAWASVIIVSFVVMYMCYTVVSLVYGLAIAAANQVGSVKIWRDINKYYERIQLKCFPVMSRSLVFTRNQELLWNQFIESLHSEFLLTNAERDRLKYRREETEDGNIVKTPPDLSRSVRNKDATRRIVQFCWSNEAMLKQSKRITIPAYRRWYQVRTMPSWTVIVPCHTETTFYGCADLQRPSADRPRISVIEYLAATYPDEWENFAGQLHEKYTNMMDNDPGTPRSGKLRPVDRGATLLQRFLNTPLTDNSRGNSAHSTLNVFQPSNLNLKHHDVDLNTEKYMDAVDEGRRNYERGKRVCSSAEVSDVCYWASMHGQTLVRTLKGLMNYRAALERLARMEEGIEYIKDEEEKRERCAVVHQIVRRKFQIILAYQIYNPDRYDALWTPERQAAFLQLLGRVWGFDLVYNHANNRQSVMLTFDRVGSDDPTMMWDDFESGRITITNRAVVNRPGPLILGEPKAENQAHALAFALNEVIQVNDMNMYNTLEDSFKIPFLMNTFFASPDDWSKPSSIVPAFRIVGFPEYTYTKPLSTVGKLMGSAEFCFVTITQRVLAALRVRMHYGHPDFLDGYWVRNRGGVSKASHLINTNEDIFTGYELLGRDERGAFVEFISQEKGRESSFLEAYTFEAKLAQGAAQQMRSRHLFLLNKRLPILMRLSLFFGSLGFYMMTLLTTLSIKLYIFSLLMFTTAGISYYQLDLWGSVISVPWLLPVGATLALPLLLEFMIHDGIIAGSLNFLAQLPLGLVFFIFQMKTKSHYFSQGLFSARGGYKGTGRGFGLDRRSMIEMYQAYFHSHFQDGLILLAAVVFYASIADESGLATFLRLLSIIIVFVSYLLAPVLFNPYPTRESMYEDINKMMDWVDQPFKKGDFKDRNAKSNSMVSFWQKEEQVSWQAWFIKNIYVDTYETTDIWFYRALDRVVWYTQQIVSLAWAYALWIVLAWAYWSSESVYYAVIVVIVLGAMFSIDKFMRNVHQYFTLLKILPVFLVPPITLFYKYGTLTGLEFLRSMFMYVIVMFMLIEITLGVWNIMAKVNTARTTKSTNASDSTVKKYISDLRRRKLLGWRLFIPLMFFSPQIIWPYMTMAVLTIGNFVMVSFGGAITAFLYNGRVADIWSRAYIKGREN